MQSARSIHHERRVLLLALGIGLPPTLAAVCLLWIGGYGAATAATLGVVLAAAWLGGSFALRRKVVRQFQTFSNLIASLREGDFSIRGRGAGEDDAIGLAILEANLLRETLRDQRFDLLEATTLLRTVMAEIDVAVFAFDAAPALRLVNRAGERLLAQTSERLLLRSADDLGLGPFLTGDAVRTVDAAFAGARGRFEVRRSGFREGGVPHTLLIIADLSRALREEELEAWKRLVRVLSHEINNSLAPIQSIAGSLQDLLAREETSSERDEDIRSGLKVIASRSDALGRFLSSYARLARLPPPRLELVPVDAWVRRAPALEKRLSVDVEPGPELAVRADGAQLDQLLINLVANAVDAALPAGGRVKVGWGASDRTLEVWVEDEGPGLAETANLFVPFFTTKPNGTGIGLVLSRQIAEAHGGSLTLSNRPEGKGCRASVRLPR